MVSDGGQYILRNVGQFSCSSSPYVAISVERNAWSQYFDAHIRIFLFGVWQRIIIEYIKGVEG